MKKTKTVQQSATSALQAINEDANTSSLVGSVELLVFDGNGYQVCIGDMFSEEWGSDDPRMNQTLEMSKIVFSRLAAGNSDYAIAKIGFGNAGHDFANSKFAIPPTVADEELLSLKHIRDSLNDADTSKHFLYEDGASVYHRMVAIEKDILPEHISFGPNGNQLIISVPISYEDFNARTGGATTTDVPYESALIEYETLNPNDGTLMEFGNVDTAGVPVKGFTEVQAVDDNGTMRYTFKNGLTSAGAISTSGGDRPQELSEIVLSTNIVGDGTVDNPYQKLATSRITSGLLSFPESFSFTYKWTLTWTI